MKMIIHLNDELRLGYSQSKYNARTVGELQKKPEILSLSMQGRHQINP